MKNINLGARFLLLTFFDNIEIERLLFLKWCLFFDTSPLIQFSKFNNCLWVCWFLGKSLSNFIPPVENSKTRIAKLRITENRYQTRSHSRKTGKPRFHRTNSLLYVIKEYCIRRFVMCSRHFLPSPFKRIEHNFSIKSFALGFF